MKLQVFLGLAMAAALTLSLGCSEETSSKIDTGTVTSNVYHNEHFGLSVTFPDGWSVQDQETQAQLVSDGVDFLGGGDPQFKAAVETSRPRTTDLFAVFEYPLGAAVEFNPSVIGTAESLELTPGVTSGADYNFHMRRLLEASQAEVVFSGDTTDVTIDGRTFSTMRFEMQVMGLTVYQKSYALVANGQALTIVLTFGSSEQEAALDAILATVEFD